MEQKSKYSIFFKSCTVIILALAFIPYLRAASLATFRTDDFTSPWLYLQSGDSLIVFAWNETVRWWNQLAGSFASNFLIFLLDPLNWPEHSYVLMRISIIILLSLSFLGMYYLCRNVLDYFEIKIEPLYLFAVIVIPILSYRDYCDIYAFYVGAMGYVIPVIGAEFGICFLLKWRKNKKIILYVFALLCFAFMSGSVLLMTGAGMWFLLIIVILDWISAKKINGGMLAAFIIALCFALLNALAPGNFVRYGTDSPSQINIIPSVLYSINATRLEFCWLNSNATFAVIELLAFLIGVNIKSGFNIKAVQVLLIGLLVFPVITVYPVILGYNEVDNDLPNRCLFIFDSAMIISCIGISIIIGMIMEKQLEKRDVLIRNATMIIPLLVLILLIAFVSDGNDRSMSVAVADNIIDGDVMLNSYYQKEIYRYISECDESDVIIDFIPEHIPGNTYIQIYEDPGHPTNIHIARFFGKNSVMYKP